MIGHSPALKDRNLEHSTTISLQREPSCFAFMCSTAISAPLPIDVINLDLASADYFDGRASVWTTLEMRSVAAESRPTALLGFDEAFLRPFTRALIEAAATRTVYRMRIADALDKADRFRVVEYVTGPASPLRELIFTPHDHVILIGAALGADGEEETLFQLPRSDSFLRAFAAISFQAEQMLRDTLADMERLARERRAGAAPA
jgi:hypothetical protein